MGFPNYFCTGFGSELQSVSSDFRKGKMKKIPLFGTKEVREAVLQRGRMDLKTGSEILERRQA